MRGKWWKRRNETSTLTKKQWENNKHAKHTLLIVLLVKHTHETTFYLYLIYSTLAAGRQSKVYTKYSICTLDMIFHAWFLFHDAQKCFKRVHWYSFNFFYSWIIHLKSTFAWETFDSPNGTTFIKTSTQKYVVEVVFRIFLNTSEI